MTLARHSITGEVADLPDWIIDHEVLGEHQERARVDKPRVIPSPAEVEKRDKSDKDRVVADPSDKDDK